MLLKDGVEETSKGYLAKFEFGRGLARVLAQWSTGY